MRSLCDVNTYAENEEAVEYISKYISFCIIALKTAILIAEGIFDHYVNDCIFQEILERKSAVVEKDSGSIYNENTAIASISGISVVTCIEIWKRFLVQRDILVQHNPNVFKTVSDFYRSEYKSMNFESEAEKISS